MVIEIIIGPGKVKNFVFWEVWAIQGAYLDKERKISILIIEHKVHFSYGKPKIQRTPSNLAHFLLSSQPMRIHNKTDLVYLDSQNLS